MPRDHEPSGYEEAAVAPAGLPSVPWAHLAASDSLGRRARSEPQVGPHLPPELTVDELPRFRRRRPPPHLRPKDSLKPLEGSLRSARSEYRRRFLSYPWCACDRPAPPPGALRIEGERSLSPESRAAFPPPPSSAIAVALAARHRRPRTALAPPPPGERMETATEANTGYAPPPRPLPQRPPLARISTSLRPEGDFLETCSEARERFAPPPLGESARPSLIRRPTTLRMEGEMTSLTEKRERFAPLPFDRSSPRHRRAAAAAERRPPPLAMDWGYAPEAGSESRMAYGAPPLTVSARPPLARRPTQLRIDGHGFQGEDALPEYRRLFVEFPAQRPTLRRPQTSLRPEVAPFPAQTELREAFGEAAWKQTAPPVGRHGAPRRPSAALWPEAPLDAQVEYRSAFVPHEGAERARRLPPPTPFRLGPWEPPPQISSEAAAAYGRFYYDDPPPPRPRPRPAPPPDDPQAPFSTTDPDSQRSYMAPAPAPAPAPTPLPSSQPPVARPAQAAEADAPKEASEAKHPPAPSIEAAGVGPALPPVSGITPTSPPEDTPATRRRGRRDAAALEAMEAAALAKEAATIQQRSPRRLRRASSLRRPDDITRGSDPHATSARRRRSLRSPPPLPAAVAAAHSHHAAHAHHSPEVFRAFQVLDHLPRPVRSVTFAPIASSISPPPPPTRTRARSVSRRGRELAELRTGSPPPGPPPPLPQPPPTAPARGRRPRNSPLPKRPASPLPRPAFVLLAEETSPAAPTRPQGWAPPAWYESPTSA